VYEKANCGTGKIFRHAPEKSPPNRDFNDKSAKEAHLNPG